MAEGQISNTYVLMGRAVYLDDYGVSCGERRTELYRCHPPVGVNNDVKVSIRVCLYLTHAGGVGSENGTRDTKYDVRALGRGLSRRIY